jgi:carbon monoxide dehydrogenase subunit G
VAEAIYLKQTVTLTYRIKKPLAHVYKYLSDMEAFVSVHPVISKMEEIKKGHFTVSETLKLGLFPVSFRYRAQVKADFPLRRISFEATVMKFTRISMTFDLSEEKEYCHITENITFKSPLPVKFMMERIFKKQHALLFQGIERAV